MTCSPPLNTELPMISLRHQHGIKQANKQYLKILELAAKENQTADLQQYRGATSSVKFAERIDQELATGQIFIECCTQ